MINPAKLKSMVDQHAQHPGIPALTGPSVADDQPPEDDDEDFDDEEPSDAGMDPIARGNALIAQWKDFGEALKEEAGEIVDAAHEIGGNLLLTAPPEDATDEVDKNFDRMPDDLQVGFAQYVAPLPAKDIAALAAALIDGHDGDTEEADQKLVATYLTMLGKYAVEEVDPKDFDVDEDEEDEDKDDAAPAAPDGGGTDPDEGAEA